MKILLDENLPAKLKYDFGESFEIRTVKDMGWLGKKNGELLGLASFNGFDFFITLDKNLKHQQNLNKIDLKFILILATDNKPQTIKPFVEKIKNLLSKGNLPMEQSAAYRFYLRFGRTELF
ncbi:MAG: hypothetical protein M3004_02515 [Bacteroidota bacterium]|nr:hypothetical protein [Bacteroidota bacterium]